MLTRRWRELRTQPRDAGMTLTELLVGMGLMTIIGGMCVSFFAAMLTQTSRTTDASFTTANARTAMRTITTALQLADTPTSQPGYSTDRFVTITATSVTFYSNVTDNRPAPASGSAPPNRTAPAEVVVQVTGGELLESTYEPVTPTSACPAPGGYQANYSCSHVSTVVLLSKLGNSDVFTYCTDATDPSVSCTPATTGASVAAVGVKLVIPGLSGETAQTMQSTVSITGALS
jgi:type II secretory pathway pseudopilin PulG